jgi:glycosyltransferase involved in cell wall biosynthesis
MIKAVFVHDHVFKRCENGQVVTSGKLPYLVWSRYLKFFDKLVVIGRLANHTSEVPLEGEQLSSGLNVEFIFAPNVSIVRHRTQAVRNAIKLLRSEISNADMLVARTSELGRLAANCARIEKIPYVVEVVGCAWDALTSHGSFIGKAYAPFGFLRQRKMVKDAPFGLYVTQQWLQQRYPCTGFSAGISDVEIIQTSQELLAQRLSMCAAGHTRKVVLGSVASLNSKYKGIQTAFRALQCLIKKNPSIKFEYRILGSGNTKPWEILAKKYRIQDNVIFCGILPSGGPVNEWLDKIDIYLQPSETEGLPRSLVEAMSRGCPCIASAVGGIPELLSSASLHRKKDYKKLVSLIELAITSKDWRVSESRRNFLTAMEYGSQKLENRRNVFWSHILQKIR